MSHPPCYRITVDGAAHTVREAWPAAHLQSVLSDTLGYPAVKNGCGQGRCGACAVLLDGVLVTACTTLAATAAGRTVTTARGVAADPGAADVPAALVAAGAVQCGYCTPGFVVAITSLLAAAPDPTDEQIREALSGNLCRCTGYVRIVAAVRTVAAARRGLQR